MSRLLSGSIEEIADCATTTPESWTDFFNMGRRHANRAGDNADMADTDHPPQSTPLTEEQLRAVTVGELDLQRISQPIVLVEYDPEWPELYRREADRIRAVLGDEVVLIEHAGSTS